MDDNPRDGFSTTGRGLSLSQNIASDRTPELVPFQTRFASISIHKGDRLRLLKFTDDEIASISNIIQKSWHKPIQETRSVSYAYEIKLTGYPWWCSDNNSDATPARVLIRDLLAYLFSVGWMLTTTTNISTYAKEDDTLIFREQPTPPTESEWMAIMFAHNDHLRLIGAPGDLIAEIQTLLKGMGLIQQEVWENIKYNSYDFKLRGHPWRAGDEEGVATRMLLIRVLEILERFGWSLYASIDQQHKAHDENRQEKDSWYCVRAMDWVPGGPVFHR
jgi:hypothetical protein